MAATTNIAAVSPPAWIWSAPHGDYYYVTYDGYGQPVYIFSRAMGGMPSSNYLVPQMAVYPQHRSPTEHFPSKSVTASPSFISGDRTTTLDPAYTLQEGKDAQKFFQVGKVFAMLYTEAAGAQSVFDDGDEAYSLVRYNEFAHTSIRRFVVVAPRQGFVYACAISTYRNRGTLKNGCVPSEHAVVYFSNTDPATCYFQGEREKGMTKDAIQIIPTRCNPPLTMKPESRIRFSKQFPIEMNVKVKDIGHVHPQHKSKFLSYYLEYSP